MVRIVAFLVAFVLILAGAGRSARADVLVVIDKALQQLRVLNDGALEHVFKTSTGMYGSGTPVGSYGVERLHRHWYSRKYDNAPMPYAIFFHDGYAIHGTTVISRLGSPASHGCVRLHPRDAAVLFALVQKNGMANTTVVVTGSNPPRHETRRRIVRKRERASMARPRVIRVRDRPRSLFW